MPMKNPLRPGDFIRTETIEPAGLSLTAAVLRVSRPLSSLLSGKADLSGAIALHIEEGFGVNETLLPDANSYEHPGSARSRFMCTHSRFGFH